LAQKMRDSVESDGRACYFPRMGVSINPIGRFF
jgi:hypothetical protein